MTSTVKIQYFALLREQRGLSAETLTTTTTTLRAFYAELQSKFKFTLGVDLVRPVINNEFTDWDAPIKSGDEIVFIPPVAGG